MKNLVKVENNQVVVSSREIAVNFEKRHDHVLRDIENHMKSLENADYPNLGRGLFIESEYTTDNSNGIYYKEYLMNRDGFTLLAMGFTGQKALEWKLKYIDAFNQMEETILNNQLIPDNLSPQLQFLISIELKQKAQDIAIESNKKEIEDMRDVISLDTTSWRKDTASLINKMAMTLGGNENIKTLREESYKLLDSRMGVSLSTRLTNKRRRMADEGVCKSSRDKLNNLDVIAEDKKLIEGYVAIVKEMAIKYGIA